MFVLTEELGLFPRSIKKKKKKTFPFLVLQIQSRQMCFHRRWDTNESYIFPFIPEEKRPILISFLPVIIMFTLFLSPRNMNILPRSHWDSLNDYL